MPFPSFVYCLSTYLYSPHQILFTLLLFIYICLPTPFRCIVLSRLYTANTQSIIIRSFVLPYIFSQIVLSSRHQVSLLPRKQCVFFARYLFFGIIFTIIIIIVCLRSIQALFKKYHPHLNSEKVHVPVWPRVHFYMTRPKSLCVPDFYAGRVRALVHFLTRYICYL